MLSFNTVDTKYFLKVLNNIFKPTRFQKLYEIDQRRIQPTHDLPK